MIKNNINNNNITNYLKLEEEKSQLQLPLHSMDYYTGPIYFHQAMCLSTFKVHKINWSERV